MEIYQIFLCNYSIVKTNVVNTLVTSCNKFERDKTKKCFTKWNWNWNWWQIAADSILSKSGHNFPFIDTSLVLLIWAWFVWILIESSWEVHTASVRIHNYYSIFLLLPTWSILSKQLHPETQSPIMDCFWTKIKEQIAVTRVVNEKYSGS